MLIRARSAPAPWKLESWRNNDRFIATRNENYWRAGLPYLDGINVAIMGEPATALRSVIAGENDLATSLGPQQKLLADRSKLTTQLTHSMGMVGIYLNYGRPPLSDVGPPRRSSTRSIATRSTKRSPWGSTCRRPPSSRPSTGRAIRKRRTITSTIRARRARCLRRPYPNGIELPMLGWSDQISMQRQEVIVTQLGRAGIASR